jgi:hypothetical protein
LFAAEMTEFVVYSFIRDSDGSPVFVTSWWG